MCVLSSNLFDSIFLFTLHFLSLPRQPVSLHSKPFKKPANYQEKEKEKLEKKKTEHTQDASAEAFLADRMFPLVRRDRFAINTEEMEADGNVKYGREELKDTFDKIESHIYDAHTALQHLHVDSVKIKKMMLYVCDC